MDLHIVGDIRATDIRLQILAPQTQKDSSLAIKTVQPQQASSPPAKARIIKTMVRTTTCHFFPACNRHAQILAKLLSRSKALKVHGNNEELHDGKNAARKKTFEKCH
jgi:hypothetical protein